MNEAKIFTFRNSTRSFVIPGLLIAGITAMTLKGLQVALTMKFGRYESWVVLAYISLTGMLIAPPAFILFIRKTVATGRNVTHSHITFFNIIEYTFVQCVLAMTILGRGEFDASSDLKIAIIAVLSGWLAIPFLIALSYLFDRVKNG